MSVSRLLAGVAMVTLVSAATAQAAPSLGEDAGSAPGSVLLAQGGGGGGGGSGGTGSGAGAGSDAGAGSAGTGGSSGTGSSAEGSDTSTDPDVDQPETTPERPREPRE